MSERASGEGDPGGDRLFDGTFLSKVEQLHLIARRLFGAGGRGERRSRRPGASLEFADYRDYASGDDLRTIDWRVYGRLDRLFVKLFEEEEDLHIHLLIDASSSMRWNPADPGRSGGAGGAHPKFDQARRVAAALAYISLAHLDRVNVYYFSDRLLSDAGMRRGRNQFPVVLRFLRRAPAPESPTDLASALGEFTARVRRPGLAVLLGDLLDPGGFERGLDLLHYHHFETQVIQILLPEELDPDLSGDVRLLDCETGERLDLLADPATLRAYRRTARAHLARLAGFCRTRQIGHVRADATLPFEELVLRALREGRVLR